MPFSLSTLNSALAGALLPLALAGLVACSSDEPVAEKPRPVRTVIAAPANKAEDILQTGEIRPQTETDLGFRLDGRLTARLFDVGATVTKGDLLATLDDTTVTNDVRSAEADHASALASEELAKTALDRQRTLLEKNIVAQARVDEAETNWRSADARRKATRSTLDTARERLGFTRLTAPSAGIVTAVGANPGQVVPAGQMVLRLASTDARDAVFNVPESVINTASADIRVNVALISDPAISIIGHVRDVSPTADAATRTYRVRVALPGAPDAMGFGATVTGTIASTGDPLISVPATALTSEAGNPAVYVVDEATPKLVRKPVTVARYTTTDVYIASGLRAGERVVTAGVSKLRPGQIVALEGAKP